jgi:hypothetical protein
MGQEDWLTGAILVWKCYTPPRPGWDHDHCEFCGEKFATAAVSLEAMHVGYATEDNDRWICRQCALDMRERFELTLVGGSECD